MQLFNPFFYVLLYSFLKKDVPLYSFFLKKKHMLSYSFFLKNRQYVIHTVLKRTVFRSYGIKFYKSEVTTLIEVIGYLYH